MKTLNIAKKSVVVLLLSIVLALFVLLIYNVIYNL